MRLNQAALGIRHNSRLGNPCNLRSIRLVRDAAQRLDWWYCGTTCIPLADVAGICFDAASSCKLNFGFGRVCPFSFIEAYAAVVNDKCDKKLDATVIVHSCFSCLLWKTIDWWDTYSYPSQVLYHVFQSGAIIRRQVSGTMIVLPDKAHRTRDDGKY